VDSNTTTPSRLRALEEAARARGVELSIHQVARREEIASAIDAAKAADAGAPRRRKCSASEYIHGQPSCNRPVNAIWSGA
jgi:hypothetical protein